MVMGLIFQNGKNVSRKKKNRIATSKIIIIKNHSIVTKVNKLMGYLMRIGTFLFNLFVSGVRMLEVRKSEVRKFEVFFFCAPGFFFFFFFSNDNYNRGFEFKEFRIRIRKNLLGRVSGAPEIFFAGIRTATIMVTVRKFLPV